ncbi:MAG: hypothetical protein AB7F50_06600 [Fimbriimonadaceae bacterium]
MKLKRDLTGRNLAKRGMSNFRHLAAAALLFALTSLSCGQVVSGTMTTTKPATGKTAEQEYETLAFELRAGGFTQE